MVDGSSTAAGGGTLSITGNILDACGGVDSTAVHIAALYVRVLHAALIANNYIYRAGYSYNYTSGAYTARANFAYGIDLEDCKDEVLVDGNLVESCSGGGIVAEQEFSIVTRYSIKNNTLLDNLGFQIGFITDTGGGDQFLEIIGNKLKLVSAGQIAGMFVYAQTTPTRVSILNNSLFGRQNGATNPNRGIDMSSGKFNGLIQGNLIDGWDEAINLTGTDSQLAIPNLLVANNTISNFVKGIVHTLSSNGSYGFILNNLFDSSSTDVSPAATNNYGVKHAQSVYPKRVFSSSAIPSAGSFSWNGGDTMYYSGPTFPSSYVGAVYVGSPTNLWKQFGAIV